MMLSCLLSAYPEHGLDLFKSLDYWQCKDLIDIANNAKINPTDKLQSSINNRFNKYLDDYSYKRFEWMYLPKKLNLWQIRKQGIGY